MNRLAIAACALAAGVSLGFAPIASATEADFVSALDANGITGTNLAAAGYTVCQAIAAGNPEPAIVASIVNPANGITPSDAQYIYDAANEHLCAG
jgi:hypothetical protein